MRKEMKDEPLKIDAILKWVEKKKSDSANNFLMESNEGRTSIYDSEG